jgi:hypothetical protein
VKGSGKISIVSFLKNNYLLVLSVVALVFIGGYFRWQRIEKELNSGLLSYGKSVIVNHQLRQLTSKYFVDSKKNKLLLMVQNPSCGNCIDQLIFWNLPKFTTNFEVVALFPNSVVNDLTVIKQHYAIDYPLYKIPNEEFNIIFGLNKGFSSIMLLTTRLDLLSYFNSNQVEERSGFIEKIDKILIDRSPNSNQFSGGN